MGHPSQNFSPPRPPLIRRDARTWTSHRRWTLAMAMTDEGITDEVLVEELEKMRMRREWSGEDLDEGWDVWEAGGGGWAGSQCSEEPADCGRPWGEDSWIQDRGQAPQSTRRGSWEGDVYGGPRDDVDELSPPTASAFPSTPSLPHLPHPPSSYASPPGPGRNPRSSTTPTATWTTARRALLTCREIVRTERHYLASLQALVAGNTASVPPPLMLRYAGELISASVTLLKRMEEDPSAWGLAAAFLAAEEDVEAAFVAWCGAVGEWFEGGGECEDPEMPPKRKGSKASVNMEEVSPLRRTVSTWRRSFPSIPSLTISVGAAPLPPSAFSNRRKDKEREAPAAKRKPPVRDLAILPTQRVMRYVLLYRGKLHKCPPSEIACSFTDIGIGRPPRTYPIDITLTRACRTCSGRGVSYRTKMRPCTRQFGVSAEAMKFINFPSIPLLFSHPGLDWNRKLSPHPDTKLIFMATPRGERSRYRYHSTSLLPVIIPTCPSLHPFKFFIYPSIYEHGASHLAPILYSSKCS
ncbi:hypothetical protein BDZ94DRAFT_27289 [Collybia nuda]|uniref:DH domain-containing protein n=1 Tax=Collybia nuda TaxID=64659 RepID=A0A9P5YL32_9AGAR|nr:hypothetical protein BDZ94DRAFT_27289 [Collybia nuda]